MYQALLVIYNYRFCLLYIYFWDRERKELSETTMTDEWKLFRVTKIMVIVICPIKTSCKHSDNIM